MCKKDTIYSSVSKGKVQEGRGIFSKYTHVANYRLFITKLSET